MSKYSPIAKDASIQSPFTKTLWALQLPFYTKNILAQLPKEQSRHEGHPASQHIFQYDIYVLFLQKSPVPEEKGSHPETHTAIGQHQSSTLDHLI